MLIRNKNNKKLPRVSRGKECKFISKTGKKGNKVKKQDNDF